MTNAPATAPVSASLALIAGGKKAAAEAELKKPATPKAKASTKAQAPAPVEEPAPAATEPDEAETVEVLVEIEDMSDAELEQVVEEHEVEVPTEWTSWDGASKRTWLKDQFEKPTEPEAEPEPAPVQSQEVVTVAQPIEGEVLPLKTKGKKASKSKAVANTGVDGEIVSADPLNDMIHNIENLDEKHAREMIGTLVDQAEVTYFRLGGVLSLIICNGWHKPYNTFQEFVEKEHGIGYRKANYFVSIYNYLAESKVPWAKFNGLGWTKVKEIASVVTIENVDDWVKIAAEQNTLTLIETVSNYKKGSAVKGIEDQSSKTVTNMSFKVHDGQKEVITAAIAKAKEQAGTDVATLALENICNEYLAASSMSAQLKSMSVSARVKAETKAGAIGNFAGALLLEMGLEAALAALDTAFPNVKIDVDVQDAKDEAA
jgi:hypothetical protein